MKAERAMFVAAVVVVSLASAHGATIFVNAAAPPGGNGMTWATAFNDLQAALGAAQSGDRMWVAAGTYRPSPVPPGDRSATFRLKPGVAILGGFNGTEQQESQRNPAVNATTLSGDLAGDDAGGFNNRTDNSSNVVTADNNPPLDSTATLDGFTVSGGEADPTINPFGGGLYLASGTPSIIACRFTLNRAAVGGGGMYALASCPGLTFPHCTVLTNRTDGAGGAVLVQGACEVTFASCDFRDNTALFGSGGAVAFDASGTLNLDDTMFVNNSTGGGDGGAVHKQSVGATNVTRCLFAGNTVPGTARAGAIWHPDAGPLKVTSCTFRGNSAFTAGAIFIKATVFIADNSLFSDNVARATGPTTGGAIHDNQSSGSTCVVNSTFSRNSTLGDQGGALNFSGNAGDTSTIENCILWANLDNDTVPEQSDQIGVASGDALPVVRSTCVQACVSLCPGPPTCMSYCNIASDPLFVDPDGADNVPGTADDNFRLRRGSPCVDQGDNPNSMPPSGLCVGSLPPTDLGGFPRKIEDPFAPNTPGETSPVVDMGCYERCPCDWNGDGILNSTDFFDYLACFFMPGCDYEYNGIPPQNSQDFFDFLACWQGSTCTP